MSSWSLSGKNDKNLYEFLEPEWEKRQNLTWVPGAWVAKTTKTYMSSWSLSGKNDKKLTWVPGAWVGKTTKTYMSSWVREKTTKTYMSSCRLSRKNDKNLHEFLSPALLLLFPELLSPPVLLLEGHAAHPPGRLRQVDGAVQAPVRAGRLQRVEVAAAGRLDRRRQLNLKNFSYFSWNILFARIFRIFDSLPFKNVAYTVSLRV